MVWRRDDPQGDEAGKIRWELPPFTKGRGLDLGCGPSKAFPHFIGVDSGKDRQLFGVQMKPDLECDVSKLDLFADASMDFVFSSHTLEHIEDHEAALAEWWRVIKPGGYLVLYLPHADLYPRIGTEGSNPDHVHDFTNEDIVRAMEKLAPHWVLLRDEKRDEDREYSFFQVYRKLRDGGQSINLMRQDNVATVVRYGAWGDAVQATSVVHALKKQGYYVEVQVAERGFDVFAGNPHVDRIVRIQTDQIPNHLLGEFWGYLERRRAKFVNLCGSVEDGLLAYPGRPQYRWSKAARHATMNLNYVEHQHRIAGVPYKLEQRFYPLVSELEWGEAERAKAKGPFILMSLAGSSVHKVWPHIDQVIARLLLEYPDCVVVLVGDAECKLLEQPWTAEPRVWCRSGVWSIRESLTFASRFADLVIGPETGVLNACAIEDVPKVVILSHSTATNLTRDWRNTIALEADPERVPCSPCHMMHFGFDTCTRGPLFGVAACAEDIDADRAWQAIKKLTRMRWRDFPQQKVIPIKAA